MNIKGKLHSIKIIGKNSPIRDASFIIGNDTPDALLIVEEDKIIGILTDTDILTKVDKKDISSIAIRVKDIMSSPVITIDSNKGLKEAISIMTKHNIQKLPVLENGKPIGVLYGEEILVLDEEKWGEIIFKQTIEEVYKLLLRNPNMDCVSVLNIIRETDKFVDMNSKIEFDLFVYQEGIVLVAYNFIKENSDKRLGDIISEIKENYSGLLDKYSQEDY